MESHSYSQALVSQVLSLPRPSLRIKFEGPTERREGTDKPWKAFHWKVTIEEGRASYSCDYFTGSGLTEGKPEAMPFLGVGGLRKFLSEEEKQAGLRWVPTSWFPVTGKRTVYEHHETARKPKLPSLFDVLYSLLSDAGIFLDHEGPDDIAAEFGTEKPSEAFRIWKGCEEAWKGLRGIFGASGIDALRGLDEEELEAWTEGRNPFESEEEEATE